jgi:hypothetical protein
MSIRFQPEVRPPARQQAPLVKSEKRLRLAGRQLSVRKSAHKNLSAGTYPAYPQHSVACLIGFGLSLNNVEVSMLFLLGVTPGSGLSPLPNASQAGRLRLAQ